MSQSTHSQTTKVSIIIPVFNAEASITTCIESIKQQSYANLDVIFIDDGSIDRSVALISNRTATDSRFKVLSHRTNKGASAARNLGIKHASGEYIFFLDADDKLETNTIESLVLLAKNTSSDLVTCSHIQQFDTHSKQKFDGSPNSDQAFSPQELLAYIQKYLKQPYTYTLFVHCWAKLFKTSIIKDNQIYFNESLSQLEDVNFNYLYLSYCKTVSYKNAHLYHHRISQAVNSMSTMTGKESNAIQKNALAFHSIESFLSHYDKENLINAEKEVAHLFITTMIISIIRLSKSFLKSPSIAVIQNIAKIAKSSLVAEKVQFYKPEPKESLLIFLALKTRLSALVVFSGLLRACVLTLKK